MTTNIDFRLTQLANAISGAVLIVAAWYICWHFPITSSFFYIGLTLLAVTTALVPYLWLYVIPLATINLNLMPITGRVLVGELDIFLLIFTGTLALSGKLWHSPIKGHLWLILLLLSGLASTIHIGSLSQLVHPLTTNYYFSQWYPFSVVKGIFWAGVLSLFLFSEINQRNWVPIKHLLISSCICSIVLFVVVLWERLFLAALFDGQSLRTLFKLFFDFSTSYRVTALVADMHTGGESLDGVFLILAPLNLAAVFLLRSARTKYLAITALICICYCVIVGFTRATYAAVALTLTLLTIFYFLKNESSDQDVSGKVKQIGFITLLLSLVILSGQFVGVRGPFIMTGLLFGTLLIDLHKSALHKFFWPLIVALNLAVIALMVYSHINNTWVHSSLISNTLLLLLIGCFSFAIQFGIKRQLAEAINLKSTTKLTLTLLIISSLAVSVTGSSRMQQRMQKVTADLGQRFEHWQIVYDSSANDLKSFVIGNGIGSFPRNYLTNSPDLVKRIGSFTIRDTNPPQLDLAPGNDLAFGQRVTLAPGQEYEISGYYRSNIKSIIRFELCERNLIVFQKWALRCTKINERMPASSSWSKFNFKLSSKTLSTNSILSRHQTTFLIRYKIGDDIISFRNLQLLDPLGQDILKNGDFNQGVDRWFFYHDFEHLPWHIKNVYLSTFYQFGILGVLIAVLLIYLAFRHLLGADKKLRPFYIGCVGAVLAYLAFGFFGDPLDSPRTNMLFYFLLFSSIVKPPNLDSTSRV